MRGQHELEGWLSSWSLSEHWTPWGIRMHTNESDVPGRRQLGAHIRCWEAEVFTDLHIAFNIEGQICRDLCWSTLQDLPEINIFFQYLQIEQSPSGLTLGRRTLTFRIGFMLACVFVFRRCDANYISGRDALEWFIRAIQFIWNQIHDKIETTRRMDVHLERLQFWTHKLSLFS